MAIDWRYVFVTLHAVIIGMMLAWCIVGGVLAGVYGGEEGWKRYLGRIGAAMLCLAPIVAGVGIGLAKWAYDLGWGLFPGGGL